MASIASSFRMHGARDAIAFGVDHIEQQVEALEAAVAANPGLAFDLAKTLIESVCRRVLDDRSLAYDKGDDLPALFKVVQQSLPFLPRAASADAEARRSLKKTLSGLGTVIQGVCELRNHCGFASHGSGAPRPALERVQALLAAQAADAVVGFLHRVHLQDRTPVPPRLRYGDYQAFNDSIDDAHGPLRVFEIELRLSEVLFTMEPETYRIYLAEFDGSQEGEAVDDAAQDETEGAA